MKLLFRTYYKLENALHKSSQAIDMLIMNRASLLSIESLQSDKKVFDDISQKLSKNYNTRRLYLSISAAASVFLLVVLINNTGSAIKSHNTLTGEVREICLPDNSIVCLNENSLLTYNASTWNKKRTVHLKGEAFFKVKKGSSFTVASNTANVTVLGTSFNVKTACASEPFETSCYTGKVSVSLLTNQCKTLLLPGEVVSEYNNKLKLEKVKLAELPQWTNWNFNFQHQPLQSVFETIENYYGVKITHPDLSDKYYTGTIKDTSFETTIKTICIPMGLEYIYTNNELTIKFKSKSYEN